MGWIWKCADDVFVSQPLIEYLRQIPDYRCARKHKHDLTETRKVLLTIECWREVHPGLVSIPVNWEYSIPYGLLYSLDAPEDVLRFVQAANHLTQK